MVKPRLTLGVLLAAAVVLGHVRYAGAAAVPNDQALRSAGPPRPEAGAGCSPRISLEVVLGNASRLMMQSHYQAAAQLLRPVADANCDPRANLLLAAALAEQGNTVASVRALQRAHAIWPSNDAISTSLARQYLSTGQTSKAVAALDHFHATPATRPQEMKLAVLVYMAGGKLPLALDAAQTAYKADPSLETLLLLANVLQVEGRYLDAGRVLESKRSAYGESPKFLVTVGENELDAKKYHSARRDLEHAISLAPDSYAAHYALGVDLVAIGDTAQSLHEYQTAIKLSPQEPRTYYQVGRVFEEMGKDDEARPWFHKALTVDATYAPAYAELGKLEMRANHLEEAAKNLNLSLQYNPALQESRYLLVQIYSRLGESAKSKAALQQWLAYKKSHQLKPVRAAGNAAPPENPGVHPPTVHP